MRTDGPPSLAMNERTEEEERNKRREKEEKDDEERKEDRCTKQPLNYTQTSDCTRFCLLYYYSTEDEKLELVGTSIPALGYAVSLCY
jgi:hypothetical protein